MGLDPMRPAVAALRSGEALPRRRRNAFQRIALAALTLKRDAAWRHEAPPSIAASTRLRRSGDRDLAIAAGLHLRQKA